MILNLLSPPRIFTCGKDDWVTIADTGTAQLSAGEQITLVSGAGSYSILKFGWGFLTSRSLTSPSPVDGWFCVIAGADKQRLHLMFVADSSWPKYQDYCQREGLTVYARLNPSSDDQNESSSQINGLAAAVTNFDLELAPDEQVTLIDADGSEFDVAAKSWGYYGTPSLCSRLFKFNLDPAIITSRDGNMHMAIVKRSSRQEFQDFLTADGITLLAWCDDQGTFINKLDETRI